MGNTSTDGSLRASSHSPLRETAGVEYFVLYASLEKLCGLFGSSRTTQVITLSLTTGMVLKKIELSASLHAFSNHSLPQTIAEINHRAENGRIHVVFANSLYK